MSPIFLIDAIAKHLKDALKNINLKEPEERAFLPPGSLNTREPLQTLKNSDDKKVEVKIFKGPISSQAKDESSFPYVSIILESGTYQDNNVICNVQIDCGVFSQDYQGHLDLINLISRVVYAIKTLKNSTLENKYVLSEPIKFEISDADTSPYYQGLISTSWQFIGPTYLWGDFKDE